MEEYIDNYINVDLFIFEGLLLKIPRVSGMVNTFELGFCGFDPHKTIFAFDEINRQKYFK